MVSEGEKVVEGISRDPKGWAISLHCKGFISDALKDEIIELDEIKTDKARKLHSALLKVVDQYPRRFNEFISLLQEKGSLYNDLSDLLCENYRKLKTSPTHIQSTEESMKVYRSYLTSVYNTDYLPVDDKFPLSRTKRFINLKCADVSKHCTRKELKSLWSDIVRGKLDKIPQDEIPIQQIALKQDEKFPKLVLIKGAPGVGKTTLSWELCRQWANGQFWMEYSLVVLLRLRDESTQTATEVVDLLQCEDNDISRSVESTIRRKQGHGVLFLLEGLDELPETLRKDSIFLKLITGRLLPASTVLVTTRPWAVEDLRTFPTCSQRIEQVIDILGFSSEQILEYIDLMIEDGAPAEIHQYIYSNPSIASSMCNPLHARIIVEIYIESYKNISSIFPNTTTEVYCHYSQVLIKRHLQDHAPGIHWSGDITDLPLSIQPQFDKICDVAYNGITIKNQQLVFFKEDIQDTSSTLGFMNSVHPLHQSIMATNSSPSYNFLHLTLQEFLAAYYIWKNKTKQEQLIFFITKKTDGLFGMILLFLAGLAGFNDPFTQCVFSNPQFYFQNRRIERNIDYTQTLWLYESQNLDFLSNYKKMLCNLHLGIEGDYDRYFFALGYLLASSNTSISKLELTADLFSQNDQSMLLAGMEKASSPSKLPLLRVKHLKIIVENFILPVYLCLNNMILPEIEQFSLTMVEKDGFVPPELVKKPRKKPQSSVKVLYDIVKPFSALKVVEVNFNAPREIIKELLDILKPRKCLETLKYTVFSQDDEELLSDFVKHSFVETLIVKINIRLCGGGSYVLPDNSLLHVIHSVDTDRLHSLSIGLDVCELRKNNFKILPTSLLEFPISAKVLPYRNENNEIKYIIESFAVQKYISIINHWKLSLKSLIYYFDPMAAQLYHPTCNQFYKTLFDCPLLEKVVIGHDHVPVVLSSYSDKYVSQCSYRCSGLTDGVSVHQNLRTLSLYDSCYLCDLFYSLSNNHLLKSLKLGCLFNSQFNINIRKYLLTNTSLEELELDHMNSVSWSSGLFEGLKHNTCLRKLNIFSKSYSCIRDYGVEKEASTLMATMFRVNTTLCWLKCWLPICSVRSQHHLPLILEALSANKSLQHLELFPMIRDYTLTSEETDALGKMLSTNDTLELFYFPVTITNCQPIIKGLLDNKTLKDFGIIEKTEKNIIMFPDYVHIKNKISLLGKYYMIHEQ